MSEAELMSWIEKNNIQGIVKEWWEGMDGELLYNLTDEISKNKLGMKLYAHRVKFLKILDTLKGNINSFDNHLTHQINALDSHLTHHINSSIY